MQSIRRAGVLAFLDWLSRTHPEVRSLRELDERQFLILATDFESSKGLVIGPGHEVYRKWESTYRFAVSGSSSDSELLHRLR